MTDRYQQHLMRQQRMYTWEQFLRKSIHKGTRGPRYQPVGKLGRLCVKGRGRE